MDTSETRVDREPSLFREINERIRLIATDDSTYCLCECANLDCVETFELPLSEYEQVRHVPTHFVVRPEHVDEIERVVAAGRGFVVVEKLGAAGVTAVGADASRRQRRGSPAS